MNINSCQFFDQKIDKNRLQKSALGIFTKSQSNVGTQGFQRLHEYILQDRSCELLPTERVCNCLKKRIDKDKKRMVMFNEVREKAHWSNLQRCGSIWSCPVCAKQVTEKRREELKTAVSKWKSMGGTLLLLTLTNPHSASDYLKAMLYAQKKALQKFFERRKGKDLLRLLGRKYQIRSTEVTHGQNGWHPHYHILLFVQRDYELDLISESSIYEQLLAHWKSCCVDSGLPCPNEHGLDIRDGTYADKYVSKWGIENELTKGHIKKGKENSRTAFDLLQLSFDDVEIFGKKPSKLFQEFALSFKGSRQLVWGRGLKKLLGIDDKSDEELAEETEQTSIVLCSVEKIVFDILKKYKKRHEFLRWVEDDYKNGCFGSGSAEYNLSLLIQAEIDSFESHEIDFMVHRGII